MFCGVRFVVERLFHHIYIYTYMYSYLFIDLYISINSMGIKVDKEQKVRSDSAADGTRNMREECQITAKTSRETENSNTKCNANKQRQSIRQRDVHSNKGNIYNTNMNL